MTDATTEPMAFLASGVQVAVDSLTEVLRHGARKLLAEAVEVEAKQWIVEHQHFIDDS